MTSLFDPFLFQIGNNIITPLRPQRQASQDNHRELLRHFLEGIVNKLSAFKLNGEHRLTSKLKLWKIYDLSLNSHKNYLQPKTTIESGFCGSVVREAIDRPKSRGFSNCHVNIVFLNLTYSSEIRVLLLWSV